MHQSLPHLFLSAADRAPLRAAVHWQGRSGWELQTWVEAVDEVAATAQALAHLGVEAGTPVGLISRTRPEWTAVDMAVLCLGGVVVGLYPTLLADEVVYQLSHARCRVVIVEDADQAEKVQAHRDQLPQVEHVLTLDEVPGLRQLHQVRPPPDAKWLRAQVAKRSRTEVATIIYTSGTTGRSKGALLTHGNFLAAVEGTRDVSDVREGDRGVVFLPLAHALQRWGVYLGYELGVEGYFARDAADLPATLRRARARTFVTVPRMLEKIRDSAVAQAAARGARPLAVFHWAFRVGRERWNREQAGERVGRRLRVKHRIARRLVFGRVKEGLGGELEVLGCGGARLDPELGAWFASMGVVVLEGWGLTETSAPATANQLDAYRFGSVGRALPGVQVRAAEDGELLVRGDVLFQGYHRDPENTASAHDGDWFRSGDLGHIDADGFVWITGRKKLLIIMANGKNVAPEPIESLLVRHPWVAQAMVVGDDRPYLGALIALDEEALAAEARAQGWPGGAVDWSARSDVRAQVEAHLNAVTADLPRFQQPKRYAFVSRAFSEARNELTPTLKLKRRVIADLHAAALAELYA